MTLECCPQSLGSRWAQMWAGILALSGKSLKETSSASVSLPANEEYSSSAEVSRPGRVACKNNWKVLRSSKYSVKAKLLGEAGCGCDDWERSRIKVRGGEEPECSLYHSP